jgi:DNA modification methylase
MNINSVIIGDSSKILGTIEPDIVDLTVTSPPYDNLRNYKGYELNTNIIIKELYRITKPGGVVVWVVGDSVVNNSETGTSFKQALYFMDCGFNLHDTMIFEKSGSGLPCPNRYYQSFEYMFIFSKGVPKTANLLKDKKNYWGKWGVPTRRDVNGNQHYIDKIKDNPYGVRINIWRFNNGGGFSTKDKIAYKHPAIFPEQLPHDHILTWSNPGDLILDCFAGSGTTLKMAKELGRNYIGIEISPEYGDIINKRLLSTKVSLFSEA